MWRSWHKWIMLTMQYVLCGKHLEYWYLHQQHFQLSLVFHLLWAKGFFFLGEKSTLKCLQNQLHLWNDTQNNDNDNNNNNNDATIFFFLNVRNLCFYYHIIIIIIIFLILIIIIIIIIIKNLLTTMLTIKILFTINSLENKKKLLIQNTIYNSCQFNKHLI